MKTSTPNSTRPLEEQQRVLQDDASIQERIRQRAYQLYEEQGRRDGHDQEDWSLAERQVLDEQPLKAA